MADIDVERKRGGGMGWLWGLAAVLVLALIVWWIWPDEDDDDFAATEVEQVEQGPATTPEPGVTIGDILSNPDDHIGQTFPGAEVQVAEVPTDRGFWIEDDGERLFAIIIDEPREQPLDINPGQTLRIDEGMLRDRTYLPGIPGEPLDEDTEEIAEQQDVFLVVNERHINVLGEGEPQPGTDPAEAVDDGS